MPRPRATKPVDIAFAKEHCAGIIIDCVRCACHEVVGFEGFGDRELVIDLPKRRNWRCPRCGGREIESRPKFVSREERRDWVGLQGPSS